MLRPFPIDRERRPFRVRWRIRTRRSWYGGSVFVRHDGWDVAESERPGVEVRYSGEEFQLVASGRAWRGTKRTERFWDDTGQGYRYLDSWRMSGPGEDWEWRVARTPKSRVGVLDGTLRGPQTLLRTSDTGSGVEIEGRCLAGPAWRDGDAAWRVAVEVDPRVPDVERDFWAALPLVFTDTRPFGLANLPLR
jgi:hypothetical protein